jgi:hypothetical protein
MERFAGGNVSHEWVVSQLWDTSDERVYSTFEGTHFLAEGGSKREQRKMPGESKNRFFRNLGIGVPVGKRHTSDQRGQVRQVQEYWWGLDQREVHFTPDT